MKELCLITIFVSLVLVSYCSEPELRETKKTKLATNPDSQITINEMSAPLGVHIMSGMLNPAGSISKGHLGLVSFVRFRAGTIQKIDKHNEFSDFLDDDVRMGNYVFIPDYKKVTRENGQGEIETAHVVVLGTTDRAQIVPGALDHIVPKWYVACKLS